MNLEGSTILITGASSGIGAASARALANRGVHVVIAARRTDLLIALAEEIRNEGGTIEAVTVDVSKAEDCARAVAHTLDTFGRLDGLLNNAGFLGPRVPLAKYPEEDFRRAMEVNILGTYLMTQAAIAPLLESPAGAIVNMSSFLGRNGAPNCVGYVAGKFGVEGVTQATAHDITGTQLAAVSLAPGMVATEMLRSYLEEEDVSEYLPTARVGEGIARLFAELVPAHNGMALDLEPWLSPVETD